MRAKLDQELRSLYEGRTASSEEFFTRMEAGFTEPGRIFLVYATQGQGGTPVAERDTLAAALRYVAQHEGEASFAIKYPNSEWHKWK